MENLCPISLLCSDKRDNLSPAAVQNIFIFLNRAYHTASHNRDLEQLLTTVILDVLKSIPVPAGVQVFVLLKMLDITISYLISNLAESGWLEAIELRQELKALLTEMAMKGDEIN